MRKMFSPCQCVCACQTHDICSRRGVRSRPVLTSEPFDKFRKSTAKPSKLSTAPGRQTAFECAHRALSRSAREWHASVCPRFKIILLLKSSSDQDLCCFTAVHHAPGTKVSSSQSSHRSLSHTGALQPACLQYEDHESSSDTSPLRTP